MVLGPLFGKQMIITLINESLKFVATLTYLLQQITFKRLRIIYSFLKKVYAIKAILHMDAVINEHAHAPNKLKLLVSCTEARFYICGIEIT